MTFIDSTREMKSNQFHLKGINEPVRDIIEQKDKSISAIMLKDYLEKQWYVIHNECAWYNSHKSRQDTYYGY